MTDTIPGGENLTYAPENSLQRVTDYPVVKDTLSGAYSLVHRYPYAAAAYDRIEKLSNSIIAQLAPRLPLSTVDGYANAGLDYLEKKVPGVKTTETKDLVSRVRKPADDAVGIAKTYADGIQSRLSPVTDQFSARIVQGQETIAHLQERLSTAVASLPHDKASATEALNSIFKELESLSTYITTNAKEIPAHAQAASKPLVDGISEGITHIREELAKPDVPIATKAQNVLKYSQEKVTPILTSLKDLLVKKKVEAEEKTPHVNGSS